MLVLIVPSVDSSLTDLFTDHLSVQDEEEEIRLEVDVLRKVSVCARIKIMCDHRFF